MLRGLEVFPAEMPEFDVRSAPGDPVTLFLTWLAEAVRDKVLGPHAMTLATADAAGRVSSRVLICKDVDNDGRWSFASDAESVKGRDLAANPCAAASFYWPTARPPDPHQRCGHVCWKRGERRGLPGAAACLTGRGARRPPVGAPR